MAVSRDKSKRAHSGSLAGVLVFLGRYPWRVGLALWLVLVGIGLELALPQILGYAINRMSGGVGARDRFDLGRCVGLLVSLVLLRAALGYLLGMLRNRTVQRALNDIRAALYEALQRLAFGFHDRSSTGELLSRATTDVMRLQDFFYACLFLSVDIVVSMVVTVALIFATSALLGGLTLATIVPTVALITFYAARLRPKWRQVHDLRSAMTTVIQENIAGVRVVKAFAREAGEVEKFRQKKDDFMGTLMTTINYWAARVPLAQFVFGLSVPLVLWAGGQQVIGGRLSLGDLAKVVFYLMALGHRVGAVGQLVNIVQNAAASAERILEIIREPRAIRSGARPLPAGGGRVEFDQVGFEYQDGRASLHEVSFVAPPGRTCAIVGPTGSGKSTLVNLIPRFHEVSAGRVLVEGVDVRELKLPELRRQIGVIFQETFLFSTTVAENIAYGRLEATRAEIEAAARAAQAHEFIVELDHGYETVIGERGITLSGGQRQRLALARAFLMNPRLLILDDATASVDARTERLIQEAMRELCRGRTTFVIAHRLSTVQHADQILVLKEGRIVEAGVHAELVRRGGYYCDLLQRDYGLEPVGAAAHPGESSSSLPRPAPPPTTGG